MSTFNALLKTLKVIKDSHCAVSSQAIQHATGFNIRTVQRHTKILAEQDIIERVGDTARNGYLYRLA